MTTTDLRAEVLAAVTEMIEQLLGDYAMDDVEVTLATTFHDDLELESVDLVTIADMVSERYGSEVNLAEFFAEKDIDEVITMKVGDVVDYVVSVRSATVGAEG